MTITVGIDLGGTKIEIIAVDLRKKEAPRVLGRRRIPTDQHLGYATLVKTVARLARDFVVEVKLDLATVPIGIGMPGGVTRRDGRVKNSNTACLNHQPFDADLGAALGRRAIRASQIRDLGVGEGGGAAEIPPIVIENDANCFALAEANLGALIPYRAGIVFGAILGTGVGGGIVSRGRIWSGLQGIAGEWGHHRIHPGGRSCYCGHRGCLERYISGPAIEDDYEARAGTRLPASVVAARTEYDPHAKGAIDTFIESFAMGMAHLINILDPLAIVIGGGLSNLDILYKSGVTRVASHVFNDELLTPILRHSLGDSAGVFGAALLPVSSLPRSSAHG